MRTPLPDYPGHGTGMNDVKRAEIEQSEYQYVYPDPEQSRWPKLNAPYNAWYEQETGEVLGEFDEEKRGWNNSPFKQEGCDRVRWNKVYWYDQDMEVDTVDEDTYYSCPTYTKAIQAIREVYYQAVPSMGGGVKWGQTYIYEPWGRGTPGVLRNENHNTGDLNSAPDRIFHLECVTDIPYPTREEKLEGKRSRLGLLRATAHEPEESKPALDPITLPQSPNAGFALDPLLAKLNKGIASPAKPERSPKSNGCSTPRKPLAPEYSLASENLPESEVLSVPKPRPALPPLPPLPPRRTRPSRQMRVAILRSIKFGTQARKSTVKIDSSSLKLQQARKRRIMRNIDNNRCPGWEYRTYVTSPLSVGDGL